MNFDDLGIPFRAIYWFPQHFCELGATFAENVCTQSFESPVPRKKPCRMGPGLCRPSEEANKAK